MKWVFLLGLLIATPVLAALLRGRPRLIVATCFLLGPSLYLLGPNLWTAPISWAYWPGEVRGIYVSFIDTISIALIASTQRTRISLSVKLAFAVYCLGLIVSTFTAQQALMPIAFYAWQVFRTALIFIAIARVCATVDGAPVAIVAGFAVGLIIESGYVAYQFATGVDRAGGTFQNSNYMGLSLDYALFPAVALMLGTRRLLWPGLGGLAALVIAVLGGSRATLGLVAAGIILTVVLSILYRHTPRKYAFAGVTALLLLAAAPAMMWAANRRSETVLESSDQMRSAMKLAARMIIADYPLGIGANAYVPFANSAGYNERAAVPWNAENRNVPVHNTYYLVAAEMGFIGLIGLVSILAALIVLGFRTMRRKLPDEAGELVPGLLASMLIASIHIAYEFVAMDFLLHAFFAVSAGMLVGLAARARNAAAAPAPRTIQSALLMPAT